MAAVLTVDDEDGIREFIADVLRGADHDVHEAANGAAALERLEERPYDLMLCDLKMPGELGGIDVVRRARAAWPDMQIVVLTAHGSIGMAVEAMRLGAFDFIEKPITGPSELRALVSRALNFRGARSWAKPPEPVVESQAAPRSRLAQFLHELKRRHVYNVTATYAVASFILLQLAELVLPAVPGAPSWTYRAIVIVVIAGFPIAVALGWAYDITAGGVKRTK
jgi:CheY-like chemotaxis protein